MKKVERCTKQIKPNKIIATQNKNPELISSGFLFVVVNTQSYSYYLSKGILELNMYKNINQKSYFLFIGILLLSISTIVYAETTEQSSSTESFSTSTNSNAIENISTSTDNNLISSTTESTTTDFEIPNTEKPIVEQKLPINQTFLSNVEQQRITNLCANISNRLDAAIARQDNIAKRLNSRIVKMRELGVDTTSAETKLAETTITINTAKNTIKNIDTLINQTITSPTPKTAWLSVRTTYTETETLVKQTQEELRMVIQLLKSPITISTEEKEETSTSTIETAE